VPGYFRPSEVASLLGDPTKAREKLGWVPETPFEEMVREMIANDIKEAAREDTCRREGFEMPSSWEATM